MSGKVDTNSTINFNDGTFNFTGGNTGWKAFVPNGQQFGGTPITDGSEDLLLTPVGAGTSINGNANAAGISGGGNGIFIGTNEGIRLDFVHDLTGNPAGGDFPANADFVFAGHYEVNGAAVTFGGLNLVPGTARFTAKDDPDLNNVVNDGAVDPITSVAISFGGETKFVVLASFVSPVIVGGRSFTIQDPHDGSVIVGGLVDNTAIATYTANGYNSLEVTYVSGNAFFITGFGTTSVVDEPVSFNVPVELVDADGDAAAAVLSVRLLPGGASAPPEPISTPIIPTAADRTTRQRSRLAARPFRSPTPM